MQSTHIEPGAMRAPSVVDVDKGQGLEYWPITDVTTQRQIEEWSLDEDNSDLYRGDPQERRKFLAFKSQHLNWHNSRFYFDRLGIPLRGRVLEQGAGCFWLSSYVSGFPEVEEVVGVELSKDRILAFKDLSAELFPGCRQDKIRYVVGDMHSLHEPDNSFDLVVSDAVLHHADNIVTMLRESWRVLKPGGWYVSLREPTISNFRLAPPRFHARYPEDGTAYYYYVDGWKSVFINSWFENVKTAHFMEYGFVRGRPIPWPARRLLRAIDLRVHLKLYPKIVIAAQKPRA